jgi:hypothetical protein
MQLMSSGKGGPREADEGLALLKAAKSTETAPSRKIHST